MCLGLLQSCGAGRKVQIRSQNPVSAQKTSPPKAQSNKKKSGSKKSTPALSNAQRAAQYIEIFAPIARKEMQKFKIPASITLAQGLLESGFGTGRLAVEANNHFGIKCHSGWKGKTISHDDDQKGECFRVYKDPEESYRDHSLFLKNRSRYAFLFNYSTKDYKAWAKGLKKAGYATDPKYPDKLIQLIERFDLSRFDSKSKVRDSKIDLRVLDPNEITVTVKSGDTLYGLARDHGVDMAALKKKNQLKEDVIYPGQVLILPKK